ncbi:MAG: transglutaminase family protein [Chitinophagaceae bacterium]
MPVFKIHHITKYEYDNPVTESVNEIRIFPYQGPEQEVLQHQLIITDQPEVQQFNDYWNNTVGQFSLAHPHKMLVIESKLIVRTTTSSQLQVNFHSNWNELKDERETQMGLMELAAPDRINQQDAINQLCDQLFQPNLSVASVVERCSEYVFKNFKYTKGITNIETTIDEILEYKSGVCQDFAHLLLQILRTMHIPCRYVSGYICPNKNGMRGEGATHAWIEAWIPQYGWAGIDPTNNIWITNTHVKLAVGRNFKDCSPVKGTFRGPAHQDLYVFVSVGYEDGHVFKATSRVQMEKQAKPIEENLVSDSFAAQQQQQ